MGTRLPKFDFSKGNLGLNLLRAGARVKTTIFFNNLFMLKPPRASVTSVALVLVL